MQISFRTDSYIDISMSWSGDFTINSVGGAFFFSKDELDLKKAHEMKTIFSNYFSFDFYTEAEVDKVIVRVNKGTVLTVK